MSKEKFEHKNELDCEVTVFEGAHTTCENIKDADTDAAAGKKDKPLPGKYTDEDFDPRMIY